MVLSPWISRLLALNLATKTRLMSSKSPTPNSTTNISYKLLFPGQGSQYVGMTSNLSPEFLSPSLQEIFDTANDVLGYDLREIMLNGPLEVLSKTIYCQPAMVVASLAAYRTLDSRISEECSAMVGFSVGEITALIAAEGISLKQGLILVRERAKAMHQACRVVPSGMITVIGLEEQPLEKACKRIAAKYHETVSIASQLFPLAYTVAGTLTGLSLLKTQAIEEGAMSIKDIPVAGGFHSPLMEPAVVKVHRVLQTLDISMPRVPVYSNVTGNPYTSVEEIKELLTKQLVEPILWKGIMIKMIEDNGGEMGFVEIGPGKQLKSILGKLSRKSFSNCLNIEI